MTAVHADEVFHLYRAEHGDVAALRGLSLHVADGEVVSVLGPSGSGKTTFLNLCAGSARPSSGALTVLDRDVAETPPPRTEIARVLQHYHLALPQELTVAEIVGFPLFLLGRPDPQRVARLLRTAGVAHRADAYPNELSGGEQQRVALCAALAKRPRLLLADEPTGELDARATGVVVELLLELVDEVGAAALIVTHDPAVALATPRTIHIRDGRLAAEGARRPVLIVDEQGWLRLPRGLRERAGVRERVRAQASWGKVELLADDLSAPRAPAQARPRLDASEKRVTEIALDRVTKRFRSGPVLEELSWTFAPERMHVVAGPSGTGKTTLLNLLAALDYPDAGAIWVGGERVDSFSAEDGARFRQRMIGYVSQHSTLVDFMSAFENVELALKLRGFDEAEAAKRAERWLDWVGLAHLCSRRADRLSGGEQRRVALARALAPTPRVLLTDEPTAQLDRMSGRVVVRLLKDAVRELGTTVVAASHDADVIAAADVRLTLPAEEAAATSA